MIRTLFISDLHLDPAAPEGIERFRRFAAEVAPGADALYILGDLFEMWIGDDAADTASEAVDRDPRRPAPTPEPAAT
ncbi:MAG: hypothetical protein U5R48_06575 [Gammaproteobacteria bacterium]|nr:hypothetical protein [Gammaproteobacteria bacterium]